MNRPPSVVVSTPHIITQHCIPLPQLANLWQRIRMCRWTHNTQSIQLTVFFQLIPNSKVKSSRFCLFDPRTSRNTDFGLFDTIPTAASSKISNPHVSVTDSDGFFHTSYPTETETGILKVACDERVRGYAGAWAVHSLPLLHLENDCPSVTLESVVPVTEPLLVCLVGEHTVSICAISFILSRLINLARI